MPIKENLHLLTSSVSLDINQKYRGSFIGLGWAIIYPLTQLSIYALVYNVIFQIRVDGLNSIEYTLLIFSGLVPLLTFNELMLAGSASISSHKSVLSNAQYPLILVPIRACLSAALPSIFAMIATVILAIAVGHTSVALIAVPFLFASCVIFATSVGMLMSLLSLVVKDTQQILSLVSMLIIILSPFAYTPDMLPESLSFIIKFNPMSYFVRSFQDLILFGQAPSLHLFTTTALITLSSVVLAIVLFRKLNSGLLDYA